MNVIPPGLDFSNLKVDLPEDPVIKEMLQHKPAYGGLTPKAADTSPKSGSDTPKKSQKNLGESSECHTYLLICAVFVLECLSGLRCRLAHQIPSLTCLSVLGTVLVQST